MPDLGADGENFYVTVYSFNAAITVIMTDGTAPSQEVFLTQKNAVRGLLRPRPGTESPAHIKPSTAGGRGPAGRPGTEAPSHVKPGTAGGRGPAMRPGSTPSRIKPGNDR